MMRNDTSRWYGGLIGVVSGFYSLGMAAWGSMMTTADWFMLLLGLVVLVHGVGLLAQFSDRLDDWSGVLMIAYGILMLLNQVVGGAMGMTGGMSGGMSGGMNGGMGGTMTGSMGWSTMAWDPGMTAIAVIMLGSGIIMTATKDSM